MMVHLLCFIAINSISILLCIYRAGTLVVPLPLWSIAILDCTRDTCTKRCILVYHGIYIYCLMSTVLSETLLFLTLSWCILHLTLSPSTSIPGVCTGQGMIFLPEPGELPYGTALLLSYAGTGVGTVLVIQRCMVGVYYWSMVSSGVWAWAFTVLQVNEFHYLGVYSNDSYLGCTYISLSGLHSLHVLYGIAILGVSGNTIPPLPLTPTYTTTSNHAPSTLTSTHGSSGDTGVGVGRAASMRVGDTVSIDGYYTMDYSYWHIVEMVFIFIYIIPCYHCTP